MGVERSCSSLTRPLPSCELFLSHMWSRAVSGHGSLSQPFCSAALTFLLCMGEGNWGVDLRVPAFHQPTQVLCVVPSCIPWNRQRSEEGNGVVTPYGAPSSTSKQLKLLQTKQWFIAFKLSLFQLSASKGSGSHVKLQPSPALLTPVVWLGRWMRQGWKIFLLKRQDKIQSILLAK